MQNALVLNAGSSSIKFALFSARGERSLQGQIENIFELPTFSYQDEKEKVSRKLETSGYDAALEALFNWLKNHPHTANLAVIGHRIVHGGSVFLGPTRINATHLQTLKSLVPLAPLHQTYNLKAIEMAMQVFETLPQIACFDTTFHSTQSPLAKTFPLPHALSEAGIIRYGFHGLSYQHIASVMEDVLGPVAKGKVITAHLGNGASLCAMHAKKSVATSMGFSALDGLMMGTRPGRLDAGVLLYLMQEKNYSIKEIEHLLYYESGLLGVSGLSHDVRTLLKSSNPKAQFALDLFCYRAAQEIAALCTTLQGCDALIFTAGIGENAPEIRQRIVHQLQWLGIVLDADKNNAHAALIHASESLVKVAVIATDEEQVIAAQASDFAQ